MFEENHAHVCFVRQTVFVLLSLVRIRKQQEPCTSYDGVAKMESDHVTLFDMEARRC